VKRILSKQKPTIIIAAYNEENNIAKLLNALGSGKSESFQILVVCNGCTDNTENIVNQDFPAVILEVSKIASKSLAIRHAESLNPGYPRLYLDADISINAEQAEILFQSIDQDKKALFVPSSKTDTQLSDFFVKKYYEAWYSTDFVKQQGFGCGCYLLNEASRQEFELWPELVSDDGFLREIYSEIIIINKVCVTVSAPKTLRSLLKIKTRSKYGNMELKKFISNDKNIQKIIKKRPQSTLLSASLHQSLIYYFVNTYAKLAAHWNILTGSFKWHRDNSNR